MIKPIPLRRNPKLGDDQFNRDDFIIDRYVPLLPLLVELVDHHHATRPPARSGRLVERDDGQPFDRRTIHRYVTAVAKRAGVGPVHPHQPPHPRHPKPSTAA